MTRRILAVDLGSHLGLAWRDGERVRTRQVFLPQGGGQHGPRCVQFLYEFRRTLMRLEPQVVAYEYPSSVRGFWATRALFGMEGVMLAECEDRALSYVECKARDAKRVLGGCARAGKEDMQASALREYGLVGISEDEADAVGVLLWVERLPAATWGEAVAE